MSPSEPDEPRAGMEWWVRAAYALALVEVAGLIYLGSKPAGLGPLKVYLFGPFALGLAAFLCALVGLVVCLVRRPFLSRGRLGGWFAVALVIGTSSYPFPFPARRAERPSAVLLELPVEGEWLVQWGGDDSDRNLPARARADRRFGYDLVPGIAFDEEAQAPVVYAPCRGEVVAVRHNEMSEYDEIIAGLHTHVVLEIAPGEYLFLAALGRESVLVDVGDVLERGAELGRVSTWNNSTFTRGPHLILFLQDTPDLLWGQGIPLVFGELLVNGERRERAQPRGQSVRDPQRQPGDVVSRVR